MDYLTQDDYKLWTGETVTFTDVDWSRIVSNALTRLASFLCLEELPVEDGKLPDDFQEVLANFISGILKARGSSQEVASKRVRNFTISFRSSEVKDAFVDVVSKYGDIVDKYSLCGLGFAVEKSKRYCCGCL